MNSYAFWCTLITAHHSASKCIPVHPNASWRLTLHFKFCSQEVPSALEVDGMFEHSMLLRSTA